MSAVQNAVRPRLLLLIAIALLIIVADQFSKSWMVYKLSAYTVQHPGATYSAFLPEYFALHAGTTKPGQAAHGDGLVVAKYAPFLGRTVVWDPWIQFRLVTNTGAAFSVLEGNSFLLSFVSLLIVSLLLFVWYSRFRYSAAMTVVMALIIGGALGNFIDRFRLHEVVDFIAVLIPWIGRVFKSLGDPYQFPIFNVADSCAVCGTITLALFLLRMDGRRASAPPPPVVKPFPGGMQLDEDALAEARELRDHHAELRESPDHVDYERQAEHAAGPAEYDVAVQGAVYESEPEAYTTAGPDDVVV